MIIHFQNHRIPAKFGVCIIEKFYDFERLHYGSLLESLLVGRESPRDCGFIIENFYDVFGWFSAEKEGFSMDF